MKNTKIAKNGQTWQILISNDSNQIKSAQNQQPLPALAHFGPKPKTSQGYQNRKKKLSKTPFFRDFDIPAKSPILVGNEQT